MPRSTDHPIVWTYAVAAVVSLLYLGVFWANAVLLVPDAVALALEVIHAR